MATAPVPRPASLPGNFDENRGGLAIPSTMIKIHVRRKQSAFSVVELNAMITEGTLKWMLRTHPDFNAQAFRSAFDAAFDGLRTNQPQVLSDIDSDDLDAIGDFLGSLTPLYIPGQRSIVPFFLRNDADNDIKSEPETYVQQLPFRSTKTGPFMPLKNCWRI